MEDSNGKFGSPSRSNENETIPKKEVSPWAKRAKKMKERFQKTKKNNSQEDDSFVGIRDSSIAETSPKLNNFVNYVTGTSSALQGYFNDNNNHDGDSSSSTSSSSSNSSFAQTNSNYLPKAPQSSTLFDDDDGSKTIFGPDNTYPDFPSFSNFPLKSQSLDKSANGIQSIDDQDIYVSNSSDDDATQIQPQDVINVQKIQELQDESSDTHLSPSRLRQIANRLSPPKLSRKRTPKSNSTDATIISSLSSSTSATSESGRRPLPANLSPRELNYSKRLSYKHKKKRKTKLVSVGFLPMETIDEVDNEEDRSVLSWITGRSSAVNSSTSHLSVSDQRRNEGYISSRSMMTKQNSQDKFIRGGVFTIHVPRSLKILIYLIIAVSMIVGIYLGFDFTLNNRDVNGGGTGPAFIETEIDAKLDPKINAKEFAAFFNDSTFPSLSPLESPFLSPSETPSIIPTISLSLVPTSKPSYSPSLVPSKDKSKFPSFPPTITPSYAYSGIPTYLKSHLPSVTASTQPSHMPSQSHSLNPSKSYMPTMRPSIHHSSVPSRNHSSPPSNIPSFVHSIIPSYTQQPSTSHSLSPSNSEVPSVSPTNQLSLVPSLVPSFAHSMKPTNSIMPSLPPSLNPSQSLMPTLSPSILQSFLPSMSHSIIPSNSVMPSPSPSASHSELPSIKHSPYPSISQEPTHIPTFKHLDELSSETNKSTLLRDTKTPSISPILKKSIIPSSSTKIPTFLVRPTNKIRTPDPTSFSPTSRPTATQSVIFYVLPEIEYIPNDELQVYNQVNGVPDDADFIIHMGGFNSDITRCDEMVFSIIETSIQTATETPVFLIPSDSDYLLCPDPFLAWTYWNKYFGNFDRYWDHPLQVRRQASRPENYSFFLNGFVLFIGVHIIDANSIHTQDHTLLMMDNLEWTLTNIYQYQNTGLESVVIFGHTSRLPVHDDYFEPLAQAVESLDIPIAYIHGDSSSMAVTPGAFGVKNIMNVDVKSGVMTPVRVTVTKGDMATFSFEFG